VVKADVLPQAFRITILNPASAKAHGSASGTGYGLPDARRIIGEHGGSVTDPHRDSSRGDLWTTHVILPRAEGPMEEQGANANEG
jgi:nitrogen-specific signal transduction histidine kinase